MTLSQIAAELKLRPLTPGLDDSAEASAAHASDLLSDVLANAPAGGVLLTLQVHLNVIAVAVHAGLAAVVFTSGRVPDEPIVAKAEEESIVLYVTDQPTFDVAGRLYELGLRGGGA